MLISTSMLLFFTLLDQLCMIHCSKIILLYYTSSRTADCLVIITELNCTSGSFSHEALVVLSWLHVFICLCLFSFSCVSFFSILYQFYYYWFLYSSLWFLHPRHPPAPGCQVSCALLLLLLLFTLSSDVFCPPGVSMLPWLPFCVHVLIVFLWPLNVCVFCPFTVAHVHWWTFILLLNNGYVL